MSSETSAPESLDEESGASDRAGGGYVHRPGAIDEPAGGDELAESEPYTGKATGEGFGKQGWLLVVGVIVCFLVIPGFIYLNPTAPAQLGWTFFATFLVMPLIPAVLLGLLAVWSMQAAS